MAAYVLLAGGSAHACLASLVFLAVIVGKGQLRMAKPPTTQNQFCYQLQQQPLSKILATRRTTFGSPADVVETCGDPGGGLLVDGETKQPDKQGVYLHLYANLIGCSFWFLSFETLIKKQSSRLSTITRHEIKHN